MTSDQEKFWDERADRFDEEVDHGLRSSDARSAWDSLLGPLLPAGSARIADVGCGIGSLSVLLAQRGHQVSGIDLSGAMLSRAVSKAAIAGVHVDFRKGDAADPPLASGSFDVVLARHVLWLFQDLDTVLSNWLRLLAPKGRLILIEGRWSTGVGLTADMCHELLMRHRNSVEIHNLSDDSRLWGRAVDDERFLAYSRD